ncbi:MULTISPECIES: N-acetylglucosamine-6-phosphate deacetylase [Gordonibacter]|uniref:N-acetylglucosamine-6-phosphate deacetylase n=2 Tax=Gordonibacter TaxID=644652 RepID=A0ABT7DN13_9ACTN|nr:N-acetylglucosamine-6-phosphate deacetylase [Gordonibacter sp. KGMB12511]MDJ1650925.1 N-acetylglucosamine-6-phosphate deacetylase [Gordonibacter sp. KGMB12511]HIW75013.1 N-acetylglucosamine-6-phosphate deacetylase [Candidatus Gordonibacter avicola]
MRITGGKVFTGDEFAERDVAIEDGRFVLAAGTAGEGAVVDATGCYVIPGLIDLHFHGCAGFDFCDGTPEALNAIARFEASRGVTAICPATMTYPEDVLGPLMDAATAYSAPADGAALVGINMEGPYLSPDNIGAQNPAYLHVPDEGMFRRLQERAQGLVKLVDVAPEVEGALEFIRAVADEVRVSVAHTQATYDQTCAAIEAGARQMTHLCNAMPPLHHRKPGPIAAAFDCPEVTAELIADGVHIHPAMVRLLMAAFGDDRIILISDSMRATGLDDGEYDLGGQNVTVRGNRATLADGTIAGSATDLMSCVRIAVQDMGVPLPSAIKAASTNPARALGLRDRGSLAPGHIADAVVLDENLEIRHIILRGKLLEA